MVSITTACVIDREGDDRWLRLPAEIDSRAARHLAQEWVTTHISN
jgi:hypothetical protein